MFGGGYASSLTAQPVKGTVIDEIIAKVDDYIITLSDLELTYRDVLKQGGTDDGTLKCAIFESLVVNKLLLAKAEIDSVIVTPEEVDQNLNQRMQMMISQVGSQEAIEEFYNKTIEQFKDDLRERINEQMTVARMQDEITASVEVTPTEVKKFFNSIPADSLPYYSTEVSIAQIVKKPEIGIDQRDKARERLSEIKEMIVNGKVVTDRYDQFTLSFQPEQMLVVENEAGDTFTGSWNLTERNNLMVMEVESDQEDVSRLSDEWIVGSENGKVKLTNRSIDNFTNFILEPVDSNSEEGSFEGSWKITRAQLTGASFAEMAKKYSDDPGSAVKGGDLGFQGRGNLVPEYEATALKLRPGEIADPVESQFGFHLIQLIERRGNQYHSRHILIKTTSSELDVASAENYLDSVRTMIQNDSITFQSAAKEISEDKQTAGSGGFFVDDTGALRVPTDQLDPVIFFTIDTMNVGEISRPIEFNMPDGSKAVRILYFKDRIPPHQGNLRQDYQKFRLLALERKKNNILTEWLEDARNDVFIDIDPNYDNCNILQSRSNQ